MEANELRIGNWYKQLHTGKYTQVDLFLFHELYDDETYLDHLQPIPLTPEILEKCGFIKTSYSNHKSNPYIAQEIRDLDFFDHRFNNMVISGVGRPIDFFEVEYCALDIEERTYIAKINYLHQLQNLYYALTNEELIINL